MADEFRHNYLRLCKEHHIDTQDCVLLELKCATQGSKKTGLSLNFSAQSLACKTCAVLGKLLATDRIFSELRFNDCMLPEDAVKAIAGGLCKNVACKKLELKGNNIRGAATEALGRMLLQNKTLLSLCLEWNAMGMVDEAFSVFCEGLAANTHLQRLDLRNNQIHHDEAKEVAQALKRNVALRALDLRWNNIGLIGGRALLDCLQHNKTIIKMELAGNNIPNDILHSIDTAIGHNVDRANMTNEHIAREKMLSREIQYVEKDKQNQLQSLLDKLDRQDATLRQTNHSATERVVHLQDALEERKAQFNDLATKLALAESELAISESKVTELGSLLTKAKDDQENFHKHHQFEMKHMREERAMAESKLNKELLEYTEKNLQLGNKGDELDRKCRSQQEQVFELKELLAHTQADGKLKAAQFEERIQLEKQKTKEAYQEAEERKAKEVERIKRDAEDSEYAVKERMHKMELHRVELEEEISRLKSLAAAEKLQAEEQLSVTKQRIKNEEEQRVRQLEEKIRILQASKDDLQNHSSHQGTLVSVLQSKHANLNLENETLRRKIEDLNQELGGKASEMHAEVGKAKLEMTQRVQKLEAERLSQSELYDKIAKLEKQLSELQSSHQSTVNDKNKEMELLQERLRMKEMELRQIREDQAQRASMLQTAVQTYISGATKY